MLVRTSCHMYRICVTKELQVAIVLACKLVATATYYCSSSMGVPSVIIAIHCMYL